MGIESKDVELRVRARDYSKKTLDDVTASLRGLSKAQEEQLAAAKRGEVSTKELEVGYRKIESALQALSKQGALIKVFEDQSKALADVTAKLDKARRAQTEFKNSLSGTETLTKAQVSQQKALAAEVSRTEKAQQAAQTRLERTTASLASYGIASDKVVASQKRIKDAIADGNKALAQQDKAIDVNAQALLQKANADRAAAENLVTQAMHRSGQQAEATARGYQTLARSVGSIRGDDLRKQLDSIANPSKAALSNMDGLGKAVDSLGKRVAAINGPVKQYRQTMAELEAAQRGAANIAGQIDGYRRQMEAVRSARTEYAAARTEVMNLAAQMKAGNVDTANFATQMSKAQNALKTSATAMQQQVTAARQLRNDLRQAGVDTKNLAAAEQTLIRNTRETAKAVTSLSDAFEKNGAAVEKAGKKFKFFGGDRTTLSYTQRLRGEVLALTTSYVGLQAALGLAGGALDAFKQKQKIDSMLGALTGGDMSKVKEEWAYLEGQANRIGFALAEVAPEYTKFAIAAKSAGQTQQETRYIFEQFAQAARIAGQSTDEFKGTLNAVQQMMSKGKIQAEELRGQLGDRLAGAVTIAANALGKTSAEFDKMLEKGEVSADFLVQIAAELGKTYTGADKAAQSLGAAEARFQNSVFSFKVALAENGFADAYTKFLTELAALLSSDEGQRLAKGLGEAFTAVIDVLKWCAENIDLVKGAFQILIGLAVIKWLSGVAASVMTLGKLFVSLTGYVLKAIGVLRTVAVTTTAVGTAASGATGLVGMLGGALLALGRAIPVIGAVAAAVSGLIWLYNKLGEAKQGTPTGLTPDEAVRNHGGAFVQGRVGGSTGSSNSAEQRALRDKYLSKPTAAATAQPTPRNTPDQASITAEIEANKTKLERDAAHARLKGAKKDLAERKAIINEQYDTMRKRANESIKDESKRAAAIAEINAQERKALAIDGQNFANQGGRGGGGGGKSKAQKEAESRVKLAEHVRDELARIEDEIANDETKVDTSTPFQDRLSAGLDDIAHKYDKLRGKIKDLAKVDKEAAAAATEKLDAYVKQRQTIEGMKLTQEEVKRLEEELSDQQKLRSNLLDEEKAKYDAGLTSQEQFLANSSEVRKRMAEAITGAANNLQTFVDAAVAARKGVVSLTEQSAIRTTVMSARLDADPNRANAEAAGKAQEDAINRLVDTRSAAEAVFKAQYDARMISEDEYARRVNEHAQQYKDNVLAQIQLLLQQTEARRAQGILDGTLNVEQLNALDLLILKYQQLGVSIKGAAAQAGSLDRYTKDFLDKGLDAALTGVADALTKMAQGQLSVGEGFKAMGVAAMQFFAQFMMDIAKAIAKQLILNALAGTGGVIGRAAVAAGGVAASKNHRGGVIGASNGTKRMAQPSWFVNAPRFHEGGLPGLRSDEVPSILQTGEEVLSRNDPRNVLNPASRATGGAGTRVVLVDERAKVPEAMQSAQGEKVIVETIRRNASTIKSFVR